MKAIRGAICVAENTEAEILGQTEKLMSQLISRNQLKPEEIISIFFSATEDLTKAYPAKAVRGMGLTDIAMACYTEMKVENSLKKCIRVLIHVSDRPKIEHLYLGRARMLRPDWGQKMQIAIDGPSGAGKSTIARRLAEELKIIYVDTGAMYRSLGLLAKRSGFELKTEEEIEKYRSRLIDLTRKARIDLAYEDGRQRILLSGEDVSDCIRNQDIGELASKISTIKEVRQIMVDLQREIASNQSVVMDGRDIGTVVLPQADYKIFLTASAQVRGLRRQKELAEKGIEADLETIVKEIIARDERDQNRQESPLRQAEDAVLVETSDKDIEQVVEVILNILDK